MRIFKVLVTLVLLGSITVDAEPLKTWFWGIPTQYENGLLIPGGDLANYTLHCGMQQGGPYPASKAFEMQVAPSTEDMDFVVGGLPGTYYCISTVDSLQYLSTSRGSNEVNFTVTAGSLGFVPMPPVLSLQ